MGPTAINGIYHEDDEQQQVDDDIRPGAAGEVARTMPLGIEEPLARVDDGEATGDKDIEDARPRPVLGDGELEQHQQEAEIDVERNWLDIIMPAITTGIDTGDEERDVTEDDDERQQDVPRK